MRRLRWRSKRAMPPPGAIPSAASERAERSLVQARALLDANDVAAAVTHAEQAVQASRAESVLRTALHVLFEAAELEAAARIADELEQAGIKPTRTDRLLIEKVRERAQLLSWSKQKPAQRTVAAIERRVINVLAYSLPYSSVGYATRSHGLARGISQAGWEVLPFTRPGFPFDQMPELAGEALPDEDVIDGLVYGRLFDVRRRQSTEIGYLREAIESYRRVFLAHSPSIVHAASNHTTALPALIAARRCGIPFIYEMRGFWEVTRASGDSQFSNSRTYRHIRLFETAVAQSADHVITLTGGMRANLIDRDVAAEKLSLVPNAVDTEKFFPRERDVELATTLHLPPDVPVIGFVGSFVDYEGIDDLLAAGALLAAQGRRFYILLVGDGLKLPELRIKAAEAGLADRVVFTGRVPYDQVARHYSLIDVCAYPRKPWEVCELVSPLKPLEAMALEKAVLVSGTAALREMVIESETGMVFEVGNVKALAAALAHLLDDAPLRRRLGRNARRWTCSNRTWRGAGAACVAVYERVAREYPTPLVMGAEAK